MKENTYILYWRTGEYELVEGYDITNAIQNAGYGGGAINALDFYDNGPNVKYAWNKEKRAWNKQEDN